MDMRRAFLAISISFIILLGYQYFFVPPVQQQQGRQTAEQGSPQTGQQLSGDRQPAAEISQPAEQAIATVAPDPIAPPDSGQALRPAKEITVDTELFVATINERAAPSPASC